MMLLDNYDNIDIQFYFLIYTYDNDQFLRRRLYCFYRMVVDDLFFLLFVIRIVFVVRCFRSFSPYFFYFFCILNYIIDGCGK